MIASFWFAFIISDITSGLPDVEFIRTTEPEQSTQIFDINDNLVAELNEDEARIVVNVKDVSPDFLNAVVAIEDARFYEHSGVDLKGTIRALVNNLTGAYAVQGGSTITQQLVKNWFLIPEKSLKRKFLEAVLAAKVENSFTKQEILEKYINLIYMGNRAYGIEKAANRYFNKKASELSLPEAAYLAGLIKAPGKYSPYTNFKVGLRRQKIVLDRMLKHGFITQEQWQSALDTPLDFQVRTGTGFNKYTYFIDHVYHLLRERYGKEVVDRGGLKVYTTLDPEVQEIAEKTIIEGVKKMPKYTQIRQGALVTIDVETGYIKALVGGIDYSQSQFNRATMSKRATGSGFKPVVYLTGLRLGLITPDSIVLDAPISYRTKWNVWRPHNWDGKYKGRMTVRQALTLSRNTPTVRVALEAGVDKVIETARLLGIRSHIDRGYSIVLGSSGISPLEVATLYSTLARNGVYIEPTAIRYITDSKGNIVESNKHKPIRVVDSKYVKQLNSILIDVVEKGTGKRARLENRQVAGKTGTTDDFKDIWFSGFTPDTATTIWMGNDENNSLRGVWSSNCAGLWKNFSAEYYKKKDIIAQNFIPPEEEVMVPEKPKEELAEKPEFKPPPVPQYRNYPPVPPKKEAAKLRPRYQKQQQQAQRKQYYQYPGQQHYRQYPQYRQPYYQQRPRYATSPKYPQYSQQYRQRPYYRYPNNTQRR